MSDYKVTDSELTGIANAIRTKGGTSSPLVFPNGFTSAIEAIPTGGGSTLITKNISANGTYDAEDDDADGYSSVVVNVQGGGSGVIQPLSVTANGTYSPPSGVDGYAPVLVNIPSGGGSVREVDSPPSVGDMANGEVQIFYRFYSEQELNTKPQTHAFVSTITEGGTEGDANAAFNATGAHSGTSDSNWSTRYDDRNHLFIGADFGEAIVLNAVVIAPRTFKGNRQIYNIILEASNDAANWVWLGEADAKGNDIPATGWYQFAVSNNDAYRYYRLRTTKTPGTDLINGSQTFTIYGIGFLKIDHALTEKQYLSTFYKVNDVLYRFNTPDYYL